MNGLRIITSALLCSAVVLSAHTSAYARTSGELKQLYGKGTVIEIDQSKAELEAAIADAEAQLPKVERVQLYNRVLSTISPQEVNTNISTVEAELSELRTSMQGAFYTPVSEVLDMDSQYRNLSSELQDLYASRDSYEYLTPLDDGGTTVEELQGIISDAQNALNTLPGGVDIGDFAPTPYILGVPFHVNSEFGSRQSPITGAFEFHSGIDLRAPMNTSVYSLFKGTVKDVGFTTFIGNYLRIDHGDGIETLCMHLNEVVVNEGEIIDQHQLVAYSGNTGTQTTGPHLHFNLYIDGTLVDPRVVLTS